MILDMLPVDSRHEHRSRSAGRCVPDVQGICDKKKVKSRLQKLKLVLKFLVFFPLSTNNILTFVEDFKSIPVPSKEISSLEVAKNLRFLTLLSPKLVSGPQAEAMRTSQFD